VKEEILKLLKEKGDSFVSGQEISNKFGVSRTAIWKYINAIKEQGYEIEAVSKKGYRLISSPDILTYEEIEPFLKTKYIGRKILYFDSLDSTNTKAKDLAGKGEAGGAVVISEEQTMGKGRLGRSFISPKGKGIWMSIILRPEIEPQSAAIITQIAAAAINLSAYEMGIKTYIKWPNDLILNGKKVCGILTEMNAELTNINYVIMGIGINVNLDIEDYTEEVRKCATSLKIETGKSINRKELLARFLNNFEDLYEEFIINDDIERIINICRENSILIGKEINVIKRGNTVKAKALDINDGGLLVVEYENGKIEGLISGEVSVRGLQNYV
jgi:BirA family biotin operon repressor/biotin-[acetyl-CoA-carboxylase] ligase